MPGTIRQWREERERRKEEEEEERLAMELEEEETEEIKRKPKKRVQAELPEYTNEMYAKYSAPLEGRKEDSGNEDGRGQSVAQRKGAWSDEELVLLSKAVNKFPGGTHQRWEKIAEMVGRSVSDVTARAKQTKGNYTMSLSSAVQSSDFKKAPSSISDSIITSTDMDNESCVESSGDNQSQLRKRPKPTKIPKTIDRTLLISQTSITTSNPSTTSSTSSVKSSSSSEKVDVDEKSSTAMANSSSCNNVDGSGEVGGGVWTQNQQTIFEWALKQYPKGTDRRWDLVAEHIPGKSKEDCISRFKALALLVSKKKKTEQQ